MKASRNLSWSELKVGILVITSLVVLSIAILSLRGGEGLFSKSYNLYVNMENSLGLKAGSVVRLAGLDVGNVEGIGFSKEPGDKRLVVSLSVKNEFKDRIRADSVVIIKTMGLLGDKYVDITVGSPQQPELEPGSTLKDVQDTQLSNVISSASTGMEGLNIVITQLKGILGEVSQGNGTAGKLLQDPKLYNQLTESATNLRAFSDELKQNKGTVGMLVGDKKLYENLVEVSDKMTKLVDRINNGALVKFSDDKELYQNLHDVSVNLKDLSADADTLTKNLKTGNLAKLSDNKQLYDRIDRVSDRLDKVTARLEGGQGSAGLLLKDEQLYSNMNKFFKDADALVVDVKENPSKYVKISVF